MLWGESTVGNVYNLLGDISLGEEGDFVTHKK